jgi:hypothetical protein
LKQGTRRTCGVTEITLGIIPPPYLTNSELGVDRTDLGPDGNPNAAAFVAGEGTPHALIIVPVALHTGPGHPFGNTPQ